MSDDKKPVVGLIIPVSFSSPRLANSVSDDEDFIIRYLRPASGADIKKMVENMLNRPCPDCGAPVEKHREPGCDLDIICTKRCGYLFPVDTGPFSLGRRVD